MNRWLVLVAFLVLNCTGCIGYVYPTIAYVPELTVPNVDGSVHAFRVDIDRTERNGSPSARYTLAQIKVSERGQLPSQLELAPVTGVYSPWGVGTTTQYERNEYTMAVRLYRPGYLTQEVKAWDKAHEVLWSKAADLLAKEKAIDDLLAPPTGKGTWWEQKEDKAIPFGLEAGLIGKLHREALQFAASEYQRLVDSREATTPSMQAARDRMRNKAQWLKGYAEQQPDRR